MNLKFISFIKKWWILLLIIGIVAIGTFSIWGYQKAQYEKQSKVNIILSPHFDDAVLSLGGLLAKKDSSAVVVTFFATKPEKATTTLWDANSGFKDSNEAEIARVQENNTALKMFGAEVINFSYSDFQYGRNGSTDILRSEIAKDIQAIIVSHTNKEVNVYSPAVFNEDITHPDHELVYKAFLDVARDFPQKNVQFYFYEDYPYADRFMKESVTSIQRNIEDKAHLLVEKQSILLSSGNVSEKINSIKKYASQIKAFAALGEDILKKVKEFTESRCGSDPKKACEVVYKIKKY